MLLAAAAAAAAAAGVPCALSHGGGQRQEPDGPCEVLFCDVGAYHNRTLGYCEPCPLGQYRDRTDQESASRCLPCEGAPLRSEYTRRGERRALCSYRCLPGYWTHLCLTGWRYALLLALAVQVACTLLCVLYCALRQCRRVRQWRSKRYL